MKFVLIAVAIIVLVALVLFIVFRARGPKSYSDVRQHITSNLGDASSTRGTPPARPQGLDKRLPAAQAVALRSTGTLSDAADKARFDAYYAVINSIRDELQEIDPDHFWYELLSPARRAVILADQLESEVNNGGFDQYYLNSSGDGAAQTPAALRLLGEERVANMVERCNALFPSGPSPDRHQRLAAMEKLEGTTEDVWGKAGSEFYKFEFPDGGLGMGRGIPFILKNESEFFKPD